MPQAINKKAIVNISAPTGNIAAIKIPSPRANAQIPKTDPQFPLIVILLICCLPQYIPRCL